MSESILTIKNLKKTYPNGFEALKGISFDVQKSEFLVIIGLSGSGKSTLLRCINRLHDPTSGEIIFNDGVIKSDLVSLKLSSQIRWLRQNIGMIFQQFNLIPRHTVLSNVLMGQLSRISTFKSLLGLFSEADKAAALKCLQRVGIEDKAYTRADQLSGGQQQRVAIARTLLQNPQIILADEPVASLDPVTSQAVMNDLKKLNQEFGMTIICNLHSLELVKQYATRILALKEGRIVYDGAPDNIDDVWFKKIYDRGVE